MRSNSLGLGSPGYRGSPPWPDIPHYGGGGLSGRLLNREMDDLAHASRHGSAEVSTGRKPRPINHLLRRRDEKVIGRIDHAERRPDGESISTNDVRHPDSTRDTVLTSLGRKHLRSRIDHPWRVVDFGLAHQQRAIRHGEVTVAGPRCAVRPARGSRRPRCGRPRAAESAQENTHHEYGQTVISIAGTCP